MDTSSASTVISFHSFRRGTGKSTLIANLAALLAGQGCKVIVVETTLQSPSMGVFFNMGNGQITFCLNDYFAGRCEITQATYDLGSRKVLEQGLVIKKGGQLLLSPASLKAGDIAGALHHPYSFDQLNDGLQNLMEHYRPDVILLDNTAGVNEETMLSIAACDEMVLLLRPDQQDYQGTAVVLEVARSLKIPSLHLVLNNAPASLDLEKARLQLEQVYKCEVATILPHSEELAALGSAEILVWRQPEAAIVPLLQQLARHLWTA